MYVRICTREREKERERSVEVQIKRGIKEE